VSVGNNSIIANSIIKNSVIQGDTNVSDALFTDSMVGNHVNYEGHVSDVSIGDYTSFKA
jgi:glucose-1-phosphate thymidylyltransferase